MISFRVSEQEFEMLKAMSEAEGARSVSDFARLALCRQRPDDRTPPDPTPGDVIERLRSELAEVKAYVRRVVEILEERPTGKTS